MGDDRYKIDFPLPDLGPAVSMFLAAKNQHKANDRSDEYLGMERDAMKRNAERQSAQDVRDAAELKRKHDIEAYSQQDALFRKANKSVAAANMNPYGYKFDETRDLPANVEGPQLSPEAEAARFTPSPHETAPELMSPAEPLVQPPFQLHANEEGPEQFPGPEEDRFALATPPRPMTPTGYQPGAGMGAFGDNERQKAADNLASVGTGLHGAPAAAPPPPPASAPPLDMRSMAAANAAGMQAPGPEGTRRVFANYGGQHFEIPKESDHTPFGPEYDAIYQGLLEAGEDPHKAMKVVADEYKAAQAQKAMGDRIASQIDSRRDLQGGRFDFQREMGLDRSDKLSEAEKNREAAMARAKIGGQYRVAASAPTLKIDTANRQDMGTLRQGFKEWKNTVNLAIDSKSHKRLATAMSNLDSGNSMQQREAAESLVSIFKGGGQVTKASQDLLLHNLAGLVGDAQTWLSKLESGHYGDRELQVLRQATQNALAEEQEKLKGYQDSAAETFGPGSGYEQLGANVNSMVGGAFKQFGYDAPPIYPDATEPVVLGSGKRPAAPKAAPKLSDDQAIQMARDRLKKNPNDEVAKRVLQLHGGQ